MEKFAIYVSFKAKPGRREEIKAVYDKHVRPHIEIGEHLLSCVSSYSLEDEDTLCLFELHSTPGLLEKAQELPWFKQYMTELDDILVEKPIFTPMAPIYIN